MPAPVEGHIRQCQARSSVTMRRCRRWALKHSNFCQFHGGRRALAYRLKKGIYNVPGYYSKYLGPKLSEQVKDALNRPHDEQVSLFEELAVSRGVATQALKLAQPLFDPQQATKLDLDTKVAILGALNQAMAAVKEMVLAAARIEKETKDKVSLKVINLIVTQIIMAVNEVCGAENLDIAEAIAMAIDNKVRLPLNNRLDPVIQLELE